MLKASWAAGGQPPAVGAATGVRAAGGQSPAVRSATGVAGFRCGKIPRGQTPRCFKTFIAARDAFAEAGGNRCHITLQVTFMKCNFDNLEGIVQMAIALGVDRVKGHHLIVTPPQIAGESILADSDWHLRWNDLMRRLQKIVSETPTEFGKTVELVNFDEISNEIVQNGDSCGHCPFLGEEAWINQDGEFNPCCYPDAERRRLGLTQPVEIKGLAEIWRSRQFRLAIEKFPNNPVCRTCSLRR